MRILHTNKLKDASLTATTEDYNFPLGNILVNQLALAYKATDVTVDITAVFDVAKLISAVGVAGHNANEITVRYYTLSTDVAPVHEAVYSSPLGTDVFYSVPYSVEKVVVRFECSEIVSVGSLFVGEYYQMPKPNAYYSEQYKITNERTDTSSGAVYGSDGAVLREIAPSFRVVDSTVVKYIASVVSELRNFRALFVDMAEDNHLYREPIYGTMNMESLSANRDSYRNTYSTFMHTFSLTITEVK